MNRRIVAPLLAWYDCNARVLPWRSEPTPYRVWLSEIMLQQTRVEAVKPYFERFIATLPDIASLAGADEQTLMKLWEGLGYYNRARNLQKAARMVMEEYGGEMPGDYQSLLRLPGIGPYTAGAVASIAFGEAVPAVDGNVLRVAARLEASEDNVSRPEVRKWVAGAIEEIIPRERAGDFNQALMELGAVVCLPNGEPKCAECPLRQECEGYARDIAGLLPVKDGKAARKVEKRTVLLLRSADKIAVSKREESGLLAGLWEFPNLEGHLTKGQAKQVLEGYGLQIQKIEKLMPAKHVFSHKEWHMVAYLAEVGTTPGGQPEHGGEGLRSENTIKQGGLVWEPWRVIRESYALPSAFAAYTGFLDLQMG